MGWVGGQSRSSRCGITLPFIFVYPADYQDNSAAESVAINADEFPLADHVAGHCL